MKLTEIEIKRPSREKLKYLTGGEKIRFARNFAREHDRAVKKILDNWAENYPPQGERK